MAGFGNIYDNTLPSTPRLAAGMKACLTEGVIRGAGSPPYPPRPLRDVI